MAWLSQITADSGYLAGVLGPMVLFGIGIGIGIGLCFMPLNMIIIAGVLGSDSRAVSGLLQTMQRIGGSVGVAVSCSVGQVACSVTLL